LDNAKLAANLANRRRQRLMTNDKPARRRKLIWIIVGIAIVIIAVVSSIIYVMNQPATAPAPPSAPNVIIWNGSFCNSASNCGYSPSSRNVTSGTTITWTNNGNPHTVTTCDSSHFSSMGCPVQDAAGLDTFDSGRIANGGAFSHTFVVKGTYYYYCTLHLWMRGEVIVT
jgi:plastocyanin